MDQARSIDIKKIIDRATQRVLIAVGISSVALYITFHFIFLPALKQSRSLASQIGRKKIDLSKVQTLPGEYEQLASQIDKQKAQLENLKNKLFWEKDISKFLNELTKLASDLPIEFASLKPESASAVIGKDKGIQKEPKGYLFAQVPISVALKSGYDNLVEFLRRIEESDKYINIDTLNIESDRSDISRHNIKMKLIILVKEEG
jgi:Tfp pilus assembly protein PilO